jgi:predicted RNA binding protein YcfA (HicA-like mRNA interferase family)
MCWPFMPAKARNLQKVAKELGFQMVRQKGSHARCKAPRRSSDNDPIHGNSEIGNWLFYEILKQLDITEEDFLKLLR